jgi:Zn-dependent protease with chaperone function
VTIKCINCSDQSLKPVLCSNGIELDICPFCHGVWFDKGEILFFTEDKNSLKSKLKQSFIDRAKSDKKSPRSEELMDLVRYANTIPLYFCNHSQGIWLNSDSLEDLLKIDPSIKIKILTYDKSESSTGSLFTSLLPLPNLFLHSSFTMMALFVPIFILIFILLNIDGEYNHLAAYIIVGIAILISILAPTLLDLELKWFFKMNWKTANDLPVHVREFLQAFCSKNNMRFPKFGLIDDKAPQAFTYGYSPNTARIVLSKGILEICNQDEVEAVIAHELGHIMNRDMLVMTIARLAPTLWYAIYRACKRRRDSSDEKNKSGVRIIVAVIALILYIISNYVLLWFSRIRELHADRFASNLTKNPNALAKALIKIGYGLATVSHTAENDQDLKQDDKTRKDLDKYKQIGAMGIFSINAAKSLALSINSSRVLNYNEIKSSINWELYSPWAKWFEFSSTHPLIANRLIMLANQAKVFKQVPIIDLKTNPKIELSSWGKFIREAFIEIICTTVSSLQFLLMITFFVLSTTGVAVLNPVFFITLIPIGMLMIYRCFLKYKSDEFNHYSLASLLKVIDISPLNPIPCIIKGNVVGKGTPGYAWAEDHFIQDETAMIYADYSQPLSLMEFFSALKHSDKFIGKEVEVIGWYFRGPVPYIQVKEFRCNGQVLNSHTHIVEFVKAYYILILGALATLFTLVN